ncbi:MAG: universal stress protein [Thiogranum sp.]|nr:universal stress protein [Thiogranum sp.]
MNAYTHILLAVDFSTSADEVARRACQLRDTFGASLSLIHVIELMQIDISDEVLAPQGPELFLQLQERATQRLQELARKFHIEDCPRHIAEGSTRREILRIAEEKGIDLIVVGSHGRHGIQLLLGSTANAVLHGAPCDVLAVRIAD